MSKQFEPQKGKYKVVIKKSNGWSNSKMVGFPISVGFNSKQEGKYIQPLFDWAKNRFEHIYIFLNDTLQQPNIKYQLAIDKYLENIEQKSLNLAIEKGNKWLDAHKSEINSLLKDNAKTDEVLNLLKSGECKVETENLSIIRWCYYAKKKEFIKELSKIKKERLQDTVLDNKIKSDIDRFLEKKVVENETLFNRFSNEFVETELAGFNLLHQEFKENKIKMVYPGTELESLKHIEREEQFWTRISFEKRKN